jgi:hypothetical protein
MIRKSGNHFCEKIMFKPLNLRAFRPGDSTWSERALEAENFGFQTRSLRHLALGQISLPEI